MELTGKRQFFLCGYVNLLRYLQQVHLKANAEETKYIFITRNSNAAQTFNMKTDPPLPPKKSFENVAKFKNLR
jgi:hypothetical protein